jgi:hypothetical protein
LDIGEVAEGEAAELEFGDAAHPKPKFWLWLAHNLLWSLALGLSRNSCC